jgi:homoserine O-acetyltransferase/O-succinyltransferase
MAWQRAVGALVFSAVVGSIAFAQGEPSPASRALVPAGHLLDVKTGQHTTQAGPGHTKAPATKWPFDENTYVIDNFRFGSGESLPKLTLHYLTLGKLHRDPQGHADNAILLLHGTGGDRYTLLNPVFADELFGPGQPFDISKYFLILPDDIGHGDSSKPSDGLHMRFPHYDYDDMVRSQYMMLTAGMQIDHLRLILGTSMGCMQSWVWGETYPAFMEALAPFACYPVEIAGRNRMARYLAIESVEHDPAWNDGEYTVEPAEGLRGAASILLLQGSAPLHQQKAYPTRAEAEKYVDGYMSRALPELDANDLIYYYNASRNYNPEPKLSAMVAPALWINSADDFINPPELGGQIFHAQVDARMPKTRFILIPISDATRGHGTHTVAAIWKPYLVEFMKQTAAK